MRARTAQPLVALTFDDGPDPRWTPELLEILYRHGAAATFFMLGSQAESHPRTVEAVAAAGHAIGSHTFDHPSLPLISPAELDRQLRRTEAVLGDRLARVRGRRLFRAPYLHLTLARQLQLVARGYDHIACSLMAEDWLDHPGTEMAARLVAGIRPGEIVGLHDRLETALEERFRDRTELLRAVDRTLSELSGRFRFVTVPQLLERARPWRWHRYPGADVEFLERLR